RGGRPQRTARRDNRLRFSLPCIARRPQRRRRARRLAGRATGRASPETAAGLSSARTLARRPPRHHAAFGLADAAILGGYAPQIGGDDARRAVDQSAAERDHAGDVLAAYTQLRGGAVGRRR